MKKLFFTSACLFFSLLLFAQENNPVANQESVVISGEARFTILTSQLIRLEWDGNKVFEDNASQVFINRNLPTPKFSVKKRGKWCVIQTEGLKISYLKGSGKFTSENLKIAFKHNDKTATWHYGDEDSENLKGTARTLDGYVGGMNWEGKPIDLGKGIVSKSGWAVIDDSKSHLFDQSDWSWIKERENKNVQDIYFFGHGYNYKQALKEYVQVAGKIPMPPKYAFGYWWSRYWVYSDNELKGLVQDFQDFDIPMDVLIIDMDWHKTFGGLQDIHNPQMDETGHKLGWTGYSWNRNLFPEPEKFLDWTEKQHLKTALNLHPASGIGPLEDQYEDFAEAYNFDTEGEHYIPYQMADKKWATTYFKTVLDPLEDIGVDFWWLDWQQYPKSKVIPELDNTWWLNYTFFTSIEQKGSKRPLLFHRWGGYGNHRYQIGFSGDDRIDWRSLKFQTYFTSTASNVGYGYWSHDIGGHGSSEYDGDPELYVRWLQFGVFSPILRTHSAKISSIERRFWKYPNHFQLMRELIQLRYKLVPYIYHNARKAYDSGVSLSRPMYYDFPKKQEAYDYKYQYMFGEKMLVAPIADSVNSTNKLVSQKIWLPEGKWYEWHAGTLHTGNKIIEKKYALHEIPLFIKAGAIIPMYPKVNNLQEPIDKIIFSIFPGGNDTIDFYEDDGTTNNYTKEAYTKTLVTSNWETKNQLQITIHPRKGSYENMQKSKSYEIDLIHSLPPSKVVVNGVQYNFNSEKSKNNWSYEGKTLSTNITIPEISCDTKIEIQVVFDQNTEENLMILNNKTGKFKRLSQVLEKLKIEAARENWWATIPNLVLKAEQTPTLIQYNPENTLQLLKDFEVNYEKMKQQILNHRDARKPVVLSLIDYLE